MKYGIYLILAAWLCCGTGTQVHAADDADSQRNSSSSQMQYGDLLSTRSLFTESDISTLDALDWPVSDVPGMNVLDILKYENAHNFELKPSASRTTSRSSSEPPSYLTPDLAAETSPSSTIPNPSQPSPSTTPAPPSGFLTYTTTGRPSLNLYPRKEGIIHGNKNGAIGPSEYANFLGLCKSDFIGGWNKRDEPNSPPPKMHTPSNPDNQSQQHQPQPFIPFRNPLIRISIHDLLARYLPHHAFHHLSSRGYLSNPHQPQQPSHQNTRRHDIQDPDDFSGNLPPGVWYIDQGHMIYTDSVLFYAAHLSWWNAQTIADLACGWTPPLFAPTTRSRTTKSAKSRSLGTKRLSNANAVVKLTKVKGATTLPFRRRRRRGVWDEGRGEVRFVDVWVGAEGEGERDLDGETSAEETDVEDLEAEYVEGEDDDYEDGEDDTPPPTASQMRLPVDARPPEWEPKEYLGTAPVDVEAGTLTRADAFGGGAEMASATPAPWTA